MLEQSQINKVKEIVEEFFDKMTMPISTVAVKSSIDAEREVIDLDIKLDEPQILIGQGGQTLFEIQRLLRSVLSKKLNVSSGINNIFYLNLDINDYKKKKIEYLKNLAKELADQVSLTKEEKILAPMSAYERRVVHAELAQRMDVITESQGDGFDRHIVIKAKEIE
jgi:spoIIIJ-associated protein